MEGTMNFTIGQKIVQFIETEIGAMGFIEGKVTDVQAEALTFEEENGVTHIVTIDMVDTIM